MLTQATFVKSFHLSFNPVKSWKIVWNALLSVPDLKLKPIAPDASSNTPK